MQKFMISYKFLFVNLFVIKVAKAHIFGVLIVKILEVSKVSKVFKVKISIVKRVEISFKQF